MESTATADQAAGSSAEMVAAAVEAAQMAQSPYLLPLRSFPQLFGNPNAAAAAAAAGLQPNGAPGPAPATLEQYIAALNTLNAASAVVAATTPPTLLNAVVNAATSPIATNPMVRSGAPPFFLPSAAAAAAAAVAAAHNNSRVAMASRSAHHHAVASTAAAHPQSQAMNAQRKRLHRDAAEESTSRPPKIQRVSSFSESSRRQEHHNQQQQRPPVMDPSRVQIPTQNVAEHFLAAVANVAAARMGHQPPRADTPLNPALNPAQQAYHHPQASAPSDAAQQRSPVCASCRRAIVHRPAPPNPAAQSQPVPTLVLPQASPNGSTACSSCNAAAAAAPPLPQFSAASCQICTCGRSLASSLRRQLTSIAPPTGAGGPPPPNAVPQNPAMSAEGNAWLGNALAAAGPLASLELFNGAQAQRLQRPIALLQPTVGRGRANAYHHSAAAMAPHPDQIALLHQRQQSQRQANEFYTRYYANARMNMPNAAPQPAPAAAAAAPTPIVALPPNAATAAAASHLPLDYIRGRLPNHQMFVFPQLNTNFNENFHMVLLNAADTVILSHQNPESVATAHAVANAMQHAPEPQPVGASADQIKRCTQIRNYIKDPDVPEELKERCTVCLTDFETGDDVRALHCSHIFHVDCIDRWLVFNKKCPVCRVDMDKAPVLISDADTLSGITTQ